MNAPRILWFSAKHFLVISCMLMSKTHDIDRGEAGQMPTKNASKLRSKETQFVKEREQKMNMLSIETCNSHWRLNS